MGHRYDVALSRGHVYVIHDTSWWFERQFWHLRMEPDAAVVPFVARRSFAGFEWADHVGTPMLANVRVNPFRLYRILGVPCWAIVALGLVIPATRLARSRVARRRRIPGHCEACSYDLTANVSGVCPECGNSIAIA